MGVGAAARRTQSRSRWLVVSASERGSQHHRDGRPNQDAVASAPIGGPNPGLAVAVADGHGGASYVRSASGARIAVDVACELGASFVVGLPAGLTGATAVSDFLGRASLHA